MAAIDQHKIYAPRESSRTEIDDYQVIAERARTIPFTMEYASQGDVRHYMQDRRKMWLDEYFFSWVGRQNLLGLNWLHDKRILHWDLKWAYILSFLRCRSPHIKIGNWARARTYPRSMWTYPRMARIHRHITKHKYAAPEMVMVGVPRGDANKPIAVGLSADLYSCGVMMMDVIGKQHSLNPIIKSPSGEPNQTKMQNL